MIYSLRAFLTLVIISSLSSFQYCRAVNKYKVADISKDLLTDAKAVIRNSETVFEISDVDKAVLKISYAITILNPNGLESSILIGYYNKFLTVRKIQSDIYDQDGNKIRNGSNIQVKDYSTNVGYSLYEDNRAKLLDPKFRTTPFTVEYSYEIVFDGLLFYPEWKVFNDYNISVENSSFRIITPKGFKLRYLEKNVNQQCTIKEVDEKTIYSWSAQNLTAIRKEPFSTSYKDYTPVVYSAPTDFEIDGFKGNLGSWNSFGKWINELGKGRNVLDQQTTARIKTLVSGISNDKEKIRILYRYLQNKVRYVSVQIGIGGWQTIEAEKVDRLSYGDCKALSNYMKSILDVIGVKSFYTLVSAGQDAPLIQDDFPSNQFNHVILCVPVVGDTIWLECTDQHIPFGYLGKFTDNRKVLLTGDSGGVLVTSKRYSIDDNRKIRNGVVDLNKNGNATAAVKTDYHGTYFDDIFRALYLDETDRRKFVQNSIEIPSFELVSYSHEEENGIIPGIKQELNLKLPAFSTIMGNRIILTPNLMNRFSMLNYNARERKSRIFIRRSSCEIDTIIFRLPGGYKFDRLPQKILITTRFGDYSNEFFIDKNGLTYIRKLVVKEGIYPPSDYSEFIDFFEKVSVSDNQKITLAGDT